MLTDENSWTQLLDICAAIGRYDLAAAARIAHTYFPFDATKLTTNMVSSQLLLSKEKRDALPTVALGLRAQRKYSDVEIIQQLLLDGFVDRYTGNRLVFQGVLRLLSIALPMEFPYHQIGRSALGIDSIGSSGPRSIILSLSPAGA